mmetsp:Transcript_10345/g.29308  ORF Transcript_10345/g.29308 Transcript_10345/m.29308 type:complete len:264 (-) Transcript_10345:270-1061(-)
MRNATPLAVAAVGPVVPRHRELVQESEHVPPDDGGDFLGALHRVGPIPLDLVAQELQDLLRHSDPMLLAPSLVQGLHPPLYRPLQHLPDGLPVQRKVGHEHVDQAERLYGIHPILALLALPQVEHHVLQSVLETLSVHVLLPPSRRVQRLHDLAVPRVGLQQEHRLLHLFRNVQREPFVKDLFQHPPGLAVELVVLLDDHERLPPGAEVADQLAHQGFRLLVPVMDRVVQPIHDLVALAVQTRALAGARGGVVERPRRDEVAE